MFLGGFELFLYRTPELVLLNGFLVLCEVLARHLSHVLICALYEKGKKQRKYTVMEKAQVCEMTRKLTNDAGLGIGYRKRGCHWASQRMSEICGKVQLSEWHFTLLVLSSWTFPKHFF
jgi:ascorbate-specific PTS system EIIC-type component UlaA